MDDGVTLAGVLHDLREARGITTWKQQKIVGIPRTTLDRIEVNADEIKLRQLRVLAAYYGVTVPDLLAMAEARAKAVAA
jgi:DNA-binding Xre family transcriptional regulator